MKIDKIQDRFDGTDPYVPKEHEGVPSFTKFSVLLEFDVMKLMSLKTKSCKIDPIPTSLLKKMLPVCVPFITSY